jgi:glutamate racemase
LSERPIGVFDSGVGGLSVLLEIERELPHENLVYVADSACAPYGDRSAEFIERRSRAIVGFLAELGAKAVVVACNTATGIAVDVLRQQWAMPIVGVEPAIKPAAAATRSGVVGVLATSQTIASARFAKLIGAFGAGARIVPQACPGLVERIESGDLSGPETRALLDECVAPLVEQGADTLVLGCTHYPFVSPLIEEIAGPGVTIINPAAAVARELRRRLEQHSLLSSSAERGTSSFWTSGVPQQLHEVMHALGIEARPVGQLTLQTQL